MIRRTTNARSGFFAVGVFTLGALGATTAACGSSSDTGATGSATATTGDSTSATTGDSTGATTSATTGDASSTTATSSGETTAASTAGSGGASSTGSGGGGSGGAGTGGGGGRLPIDYCSACALTTQAPVELSLIAEASGIAASRTHVGDYYVNNDHGDDARFFALNDEGDDMGIYTLSQGANEDFEDVAVGPCPGGTCLYIGDIGDNDENRAACVLFRIKEPSSLESGTTSVSTEALPFVYADGPHNAETLLVHPITGEIVVVTKVKIGPSKIFRAPDDMTPGEIATFEEVGEITVAEGGVKITGGDVHPQGAGILLRTYTNLFFYPALAPDEPIAETLSHVPCTMPVADELQGEAVAWTVSGDGYVTVSEGSPAFLQHASCVGE